MSEGLRPGQEAWLFPDGRKAVINDGFYPASCDRCGWAGSSEECITNEDDDVICPHCFNSGCDCGKLSEGAVPEPTDPVGPASDTRAEPEEEAVRREDLDGLDRWVWDAPAEYHEGDTPAGMQGGGNG